MNTLHNYRKKFEDESGIALLLTIAVIAILTTVTLLFAKTAWHELNESSTFKNGIQATAIARSGIEMGSALILTDRLSNTHDSLLDNWAVVPEDSFNNQFQQGDLHLTITDLSGKIPINQLVAHGKGEELQLSRNRAEELKNVLFNLLLSGKFKIANEQQAVELIAALIDWVDENDSTTEFGAESSYYQTLAPPYTCKNAHLLTADELLMVKGITSELLFGTDIHQPLADYINVYGREGLININTAPLPLVKALHPGITDEILEKFDIFRNEKKNNHLLISPLWYSQTPFWPKDVIINNSILSTKSSQFHIAAKGIANNIERKMTAIIERNETDFSIITKRVE